MQSTPRDPFSPGWWLLIFLLLAANLLLLGGLLWVLLSDVARVMNGPTPLQFDDPAAVVGVPATATHPPDATPEALPPLELVMVRSGSGGTTERLAEDGGTLESTPTSGAVVLGTAASATASPEAELTQVEPPSVARDAPGGPTAELGGNATATVTPRPPLVVTFTPSPPVADVRPVATRDDLIDGLESEGEEEVVEQTPDTLAVEEQSVTASEVEVVDTEVPSATVTRTEEPTATNTPTATPTETPEPTATNTSRPTRTPPLTPTQTPEPTATATNTARPTRTPTLVPSATNTPRPTNTPTETPEPTSTNTPRPTRTPALTPTATNTLRPTRTPFLTPTETLEPTETPEPTATNTPRPTRTSTLVPSATNTPRPTRTPTLTPTDTPEPTATATNTPRPTRTTILVPSATNTPTATVEATSEPLAPPDEPGAAERPAAPFVSARITVQGVELSWEDEPGIRYWIYSNGGTALEMYRRVHETGGSSWTDRSALPGHHYRYQIIAVNEQGVSDPVLVSVTMPEWRWRMAGLPGQGLRSVRAPVVEASPTVTPAPLPLTLVSRAGFLDSARRFHVIALFRNEHGQDAVEVTAQLELLNDDEEVTSRYSGEPYASTVPAGGTVPIHLVLDGVEPNTYRITATGVSGTAPAPPLIVEASDGSEGSDGFYYVQGRVRNTGESAVEFPRVAVVILDRFERPVNAAEVRAVPDTIQPGGTATFQLRFAYYPQVTGHRVFVLP